MLLQPIVENSVKHGIALEKSGGEIVVRCQRRGERCLFTIVDTGKGFDTESMVEGFGISSVRQRLELMYPGAHLFKITSDRGVSVRIEIPYSNDLRNNSR